MLTTFQDTSPVAKLCKSEFYLTFLTYRKCHFLVWCGCCRRCTSVYHSHRTQRVAHRLFFLDRHGQQWLLPMMIAVIFLIYYYHQLQKPVLILLLMALHLTRSKSTYKDATICSFHHTHTHPQTTYTQTTHALLVVGWCNEKKMTCITYQYAEEKRWGFSFDLKD